MISLLFFFITRFPFVFLCLSLALSSGGNAFSQQLKDEISQLRGSIPIESNNDADTIDSSLYYDYLLASGDNYNLVLKEVETVKESKVEIGVIDDNYNWIVPLTDDIPFPIKYTTLAILKPDDNSDVDIREIPDKSAYYYAGNSVFYTTSEYVGGDSILHMWNFEEDITFKTGRVRYNSFYFNDGYAIAVNADSSFPEGNVVIIDPHGNVVVTDIYAGGETNRYIGIYANGLFFAYDGFYEIDGTRVIDLSEYAGQITNHPHFSFDGKCTIIATNPNGKQFQAIIDANGNFISDFTAID